MKKLCSVGIFIISLIYSCFKLCHYFCNMRLWLILINICFNIQLYANDSLLIPKMFQSLLYKQTLTTNFFKEGSYESYRQHNKSLDFKADNNIFFTALITYTLQNLHPFLTNDENIVTDSIIIRARRSFANYQNSSGRLSYNFWPTGQKPVFFPNDHLLSVFSNQLALPDDLDDTGIILACLNLPDSTAQKAHNLMQQFVNGKSKRIKNTFSAFENVAAYSTWFGKKMPIDFDFGVHCNILSFVNQYHLKWSKADSATYQLIIQMIDDGYLTSQPKFISPYYATTPILLYHLARLMSTIKMEELEQRKPVLIKTAQDLLEKSDVFLEKIILQTTLMKLGSQISSSNIDLSDIDNHLYLNEFSFYHGHLFAHLNGTIKRIASDLKSTEFKWYSSAFNDCLLLEYLILKFRKKP